MKKPWIFLIGISLLLIILTTVPYIYGFLQNNENYFFTGKHALSAEDISVYQSYISQIKNGNYLLINQFTPEQDQLKSLNIFWLSTGLIAKIFHLSPQLTLQIIRILLIPIFIIVIYLFLNLFFPNPKLKKLLITLLVFSSGLGMWFSHFNDFENSYLKSSIDLWVSESNIFASLYHSPHFILSWILIILAFYFFILAIRHQKLLFGICAGLASLILFQFHPYHFLTLYLITFTYSLFYYLSNKNFKIFQSFLILVIISIPSIIYHLYTLKDPLIYARSLQNITLTPPIIYVILGFGIFFPLALFGIWKIFKQKKQTNYIFLIIWLIGSMFLIYLPQYQFQRRLLQGFQLPMIILAVCPFWNFIEKYFQKIKTSYYSAIIILASLLIITPTTIYHLTRDLVFFDQHKPNLYLTKQQNQIIDFLKNKTDYQSVILCQDNFLSNYIPAALPAKIFLGHSHETLEFENKMILRLEFFSNNFPDQTAKRFLQKYNVKYIISQTPLNYEFLKETQNFDEYFIYETTSARL